MLCENCGENEATVHYTEIVDGVSTEHHLCAQCASQLDLSGYVNVLNSDFPFVKLLTGLLAANQASNQHDNQMYRVKCPDCGMDFEQFTKVGKFGCASCYDVFGPLIEDNMKKIHGGTVHRGKMYRQQEETLDQEQISESPVGKDEISLDAQQKQSDGSAKQQIQILEARLREAIQLENYEDAAKFRDDIKELKDTMELKEKESIPEESKKIESRERKEGDGKDA